MHLSYLQVALWQTGVRWRWSPGGQWRGKLSAISQRGCSRAATGLCKRNVFFLHIFIFLETEFLMRQQQQEHGNKLLHIWLGVAPDLSVNMNFAMLPKQKCIKQTIATPQCKIFHMTEGTHLARRPCF